MNLFNIYTIPPQNYIAEEILLGCILINPNIFIHINPLIKVESFFLECHQLIYITFLKLYKQNKLHPIELLYYLSENKTLHTVGGLKKIIELMKQSQTFMYSTININQYIYEIIQIINNTYIKRLMIQYGYNIIRLAYIKEYSSYKLYNKASQYLHVTVNKIPKNNLQNLQNLISNLILEVQSNKIINNERISQATIIKSGFKDLDHLTHGLPNGDLIVIAARPSIGKTSLAINIAYNVLNKFNNGVCIFSLEMSSKQILHKMISIGSQIPNKKLTLYQINQTQWKKIQSICNILLKNNFYINDTPNISIDYIEYIAELWIQEKKEIKLIIIDYLQLIQIDNAIKLNRTQELSYITRKLKLLAQNLNIPILVLSQLNRSIELRTSKKPMLSDLKESGCININTHLDIDNKYKNSLNIVNIQKIKRYTKKQLKIPIISNLLYKHKISQKFIKYDNIFQVKIIIQYIFKIYQNNNKYFNTTHNHQFLKKYNWIKNNKFIDYTCITNLYINNNQHKVLEYNYIKTIDYQKYIHAYDINMKSYTHFFCNQTILHNSIEQDSDIVLMLYEKEKSNYHLKNEKIIDVIISKNRNGPIGSCELLFCLNNTTFKNIDKESFVQN